MSFLLATVGARLLRDVGGVLFFVAAGPDTGAELWKSDGTATGTAIVRDIRPGAQGSFPECALPGECPVRPSLAELDGVVFFAADDGASGVELWKSDGSADGTERVADLAPGPASSFPGPFGAAKGLLFFAADDGRHGVELWRSDGSAAGTRMVRDLEPGPASSRPGSFAAAGGALYFTTHPEGGSAPALWRSDGSADGTVLVKELGCTSPLAVVGSTLFFRALDAAGVELWRSDGTPAGTRRVRDICPGPGSSSPLQLAVANGMLFFRADDCTHGLELWRSDGTGAGTLLVRDIHPPTSGRRADATPIHLKEAGGRLVFAADDGTHGFELWRSDGSAAGTALVKDIWPGRSGSDPLQLHAVGPTLFFAADDGEHGVELWRSDGSAAGTRLVADIRAGAASSRPYWLTPVDEQLFFTADDGVHGPELWRSDGTVEGTQRVLDAPSRPAGPSAGPRSRYSGDGALAPEAAPFARPSQKRSPRR